MSRRHPLESELNATAWEILEAVQSGFRTMVDVKGKLTEYYLNKHLEDLAGRRVIESFEWLDKDGEPDFRIVHANRLLRMECKNVRSREVYRKPTPAWKVEIQRTRNSKDGTPTRGYRYTEFEILAVCLFNQTRRWEYLYVASHQLQRRAEGGDLLTVMQRVPMRAEENWRDSLVEIFPLV